MARRFNIDSTAPSTELIEKSREIISYGGILLSPTDTIYGLACDPFQRSAVSRLCKLKGRSTAKGFLLLIPDDAWVRRLAKRVPKSFLYLRNFWPGPVTFLFEAGTDAPEGIVSVEGKIGFRVPKNAFLQELLGQLGRPILSTSANISDADTPFEEDELVQIFLNSVDLILLENDPASEAASTVVDLTTDQPILVREGILGKEIRELLENSI